MQITGPLWASVSPSVKWSEPRRAHRRARGSGHVAGAQGECAVDPGPRTAVLSAVPSAVWKPRGPHRPARSCATSPCPAPVRAPGEAGSAGVSGWRGASQEAPCLGHNGRGRGRPARTDEPSRWLQEGGTAIVRPDSCPQAGSPGGRGKRVGGCWPGLTPAPGSGRTMDPLSPPAGWTPGFPSAGLSESIGPAWSHPAQPQLAFSRALSPAQPSPAQPSPAQSMEAARSRPYL
uniref:Uncharacterized protein n=1 Tax=Pipistrellus kuhlii TaxID=59472 RepID=A0A7J7TA84_PIPKU|nr:hypothetical protein mPipKuh1_009693 [Pipistrellus kuhlii]